VLAGTTTGGGAALLGVPRPAGQGDQAGLPRPDNRLQFGVRPKRRHGVLQVRAHRMNAAGKVLRDLVGAHPLGEGLEHLALPWPQFHVDPLPPEPVRVARDE
jgi:hypothetical protein